MRECCHTMRFREGDVDEEGHMSSMCVQVWILRKKNEAVNCSEKASIYVPRQL